MSALNILAVKPTGHRPPIDPRRPFFNKPLFSPSLKIKPRPISHLSHSPVEASFQSQNPRNPNKPQNFFKFQLNEEISNSTPLKSTLMTAVTAAAFFLSGFCFSLRPSIAVPISTPPTVETNPVLDEEKEELVEENPSTDPVNVDELKNLVEIKIKSRKLAEAIEILDKLIEVEPEEIEWRFSRAHLYANNGEFQLARKSFHELLNENPNCLEACQGLVNVESQDESNEELKNTEKRIDDAIRLCKKENAKTSDLREFKLLIAQIRILEGKYDDALRFYKELEKEEPADFRTYLCQGLVYIMLRKTSEAEKSFEKYRKLVPEGHPYANEFDENLAATTIYAHKVENERAVAKN